MRDQFHTFGKSTNTVSLSDIIRFLTQITAFKTSFCDQSIYFLEKLFL